MMSIRTRMENLFASDELQEADEITIKDLDREEMVTLGKLKRILRVKEPDGFHRGIHGLVIEFGPMPGPGTPRLARETLQKLIKIKQFRWVEADRHGVNVGL